MSPLNKLKKSQAYLLCLKLKKKKKIPQISNSKTMADLGKRNFA